MKDEILVRQSPTRLTRSKNTIPSLHRNTHTQLIWRSLQEIHDCGDLYQKPVDWLYVYFCSGLGYSTTRTNNGTYSHAIKESLKEDSLEMTPCSFADFEEVYHQFILEQAANVTPNKRKHVTSTTINRQSKRVKKTPTQARKEEQETIQNRAATELLLARLKKEGIIQYLQGEKLYYPELIRSFRRCILRSVYGLVGKHNRTTKSVIGFFEEYCNDLTLYFDLPKVQQIMNACPVPLEGELIYVGCHWMALRQGMLIDDCACFELLVDCEDAKQAIVRIFDEIGCDWAFLKKEKK